MDYCRRTGDGVRILEIRNKTDISLRQMIYLVRIGKLDGSLAHLTINEEHIKETSEGMVVKKMDGTVVDPSAQWRPDS